MLAFTVKNATIAILENRFTRLHSHTKKRRYIKFFCMKVPKWVKMIEIKFYGHSLNEADILILKAFRLCGDQTFRAF